MANTKGQIVDRMDKKAIGSAVDLIRMAAHYLELIVENDGLKRAKKHLIGENRKWREALGRKTAPPDPNTARPDDVVDLMILRKDYRKLHSENVQITEANAKLNAEIETVSKDRFQQQVEKDDLVEKLKRCGLNPEHELSQKNKYLTEKVEQLRRRLDDHTDDPDFEVGDAPADKPGADSRVVIDKLGLPRRVDIDG
jgi:cell division protein FtsB